MEPPACALCGQSLFLEPPTLERAAALAETLRVALRGAWGTLGVRGDALAILDEQRVAACVRAAFARTLLEAPGGPALLSAAAREVLASARLEELAAAGESHAYAAELERLEGLEGERWEPLELFDDPGATPDEPPAHRGRT
jgi:hypothetical protein